MSNITLPKDLLELPLMDKELLYVNPARILTPANYGYLAATLPSEVLHKIRFGFYANIGSCSYPRYDIGSYFYKLKQNTSLNISHDNSPAYVDFSDITDSRATALISTLEKYQTAFVFWSGGIDSTVVLTSILKTWNQLSLQKLTVVLNQCCIDENPVFYQNFIHDNLRVISTNDFIDGSIEFSNDALYITGDGGDPIMGYDNIYAFEKAFPGRYKKPWVECKDDLCQWFSKESRVEGKFVMDQVEQSLLHADMTVDTVYDFLWWITFNWGMDLDLYSLLWTFTMTPDKLIVRDFLEKNSVVFFNTKEYQNWAVSTIGTGLKIGDSVGSHKLAAKKYIYDFDQNKDYFETKRKEPSAPKIPQVRLNKRLVAVDTDYNLYYVEPSEWGIRN